jgi:hypothetical protein
MLHRHLYLPEQITVTHGPTRFIGRFVLEAYETARRLGYLLSWNSDMRELQRFNRVNLATWFPLMTLFDPDFCPVDDGNAGWVEARDRAGDIVAVIAVRLLEWPDGANFKTETEAGRVFVGTPGDGEEWRVTAPSAEAIVGRLLYPGALWIRPDHRHRERGYLLCHLAIALGWTLWSPDFAASIIQLHAVERGVADRYGLSHVERAVHCRNSPRLGDRDMVLAWVPRAEFRAVIEAFRDQELMSAASEPLATLRTTESSEATGPSSPPAAARRLHGRISRS